MYFLQSNVHFILFNMFSVTIVNVFKNNNLNLIIFTLTYIIVFPSCLQIYGFVSSLVSIVISYGLSKWILVRFEGEADSWEVTEGLRMAAHLSRLAMSVSAFGHLLVYQEEGMEARVYHLFPELPNLMPLTVLLCLATLVNFGLQLNSCLRLVLDGIVLVLVLSFFGLAGQKLLRTTTPLVVRLKLTGINEILGGLLMYIGQFLRLSNTDYEEKRNISKEFWLSFITLGISVFLNKESEPCSGSDCLRSDFRWYEPLYLALSLTSLGLVLVHIFKATEQNLKKSKLFQDSILYISEKLSSKSALVVGVLCMPLLYLYSTSMLLITFNSSIILGLTLESLQQLLDFVSSIAGCEEYPEEEECRRSQEVSKESESSADEEEIDKESLESCPDIDLIVRQYKAQVLLNGKQSVREDYLQQRGLYLLNFLVVLMGVTSVLASLTLQTGRYLTCLGLASGVMILGLLFTWTACRLDWSGATGLNGSGLRLLSGRVLRYTVTCLLLGLIPVQAVGAIALCLVPGVLVKVFIFLRRLKRRDKPGEYRKLNLELPGPQPLLIQTVQGAGHQSPSSIDLGLLDSQGDVTPSCDDC